MFVSENSKLMKEWDYEKNAGLNPELLTLGSNKKVWWKCQNGHSWYTTVDKRSIGENCPYCSNRKVWSGYNDIKTVCPQLLKEWDYKKNGELDPSKIVYTSCKKVWWKCSKCGFEWETSVRNRAKYGHGCKFCSLKEGAKKKNKKNLEKNGTLADTFLIKEWDYGKNKGLNPKEFTKQSHRKVWWKCSECGYEWEAKINNRFNGKGCPKCAHKVLILGENDLATVYPELAAEWNYEKNGKLKPNMVTAGSGKKVWWRCPMGHEYSATILHRSSGTDCPICNSGRQTSFTEQIVYFYIKKFFPDAINRCKTIIGNRMELDIYIPSVKVAIEYDGSFWHKGDKREREERKYQLCKKKNIRLLRIKELPSEEETAISDYTYFVKYGKNQKDLENVIKLILKKLLSESNLGKTTNNIDDFLDININRDSLLIRENIIGSKENSIQDLYPELVKEWHPVKNGNLKPNMFTQGSDTKIWWKCSVCGNEWATSINHRTLGHTNCPACYEKNRRKNHPSSKKINQYTKENVFIKKWDSISEASRVLNISSGNICSCLKHKRKFAGGYKWEYYDDV